MKVLIFAVLFFMSSEYAGAQPAARQDPPKFLGREVTITEPELEDEFFPKGPATVCVEGPPQRQCYTVPRDFGRSPAVSVIQLGKEVPALFSPRRVVESAALEFTLRCCGLMRGRVWRISSH